VAEAVVAVLMPLLNKEDQAEAELLLQAVNLQMHQVKVTQVEIEQVETLAQLVVQDLAEVVALVALVYQAVTDLNQVEVVTVETVHHLT
jgi:hypothetical protein